VLETIVPLGLIVSLVTVVLCDVRLIDAVVTRVADAITIEIFLTGVGCSRAVVARVPDAVPVSIVLREIDLSWAVVARVADSVVIAIFLGGVRNGRAVVTAVEHVVSIEVIHELVGIVPARTVVTRVADSVPTRMTIGVPVAEHVCQGTIVIYVQYRISVVVLGEIVALIIVESSRRQDPIVDFLVDPVPLSKGSTASGLDANNHRTTTAILNYWTSRVGRIHNRDRTE
jgi:hypothetical protein